MKRSHKKRLHPMPIVQRIAKHGNVFRLISQYELGIRRFSIAIGISFLVREVFNVCLRQRKRNFAHAFSNALFHARDGRMTQQEAADAVGITLRWYQKIENGSSRPSFFVGLQLIVLFDLSPTMLLQEVGIHVPVHTR